MEYFSVSAVLLYIYIYIVYSACQGQQVLSTHMHCTLCAYLTQVMCMCVFTDIFHVSDNDVAICAGSVVLTQTHPAAPYVCRTGNITLRCQYDGWCGVSVERGVECG